MAKKGISPHFPYCRIAKGEAVPLTAGAVVDLGSVLLAEDSVEVDERAARLVRRWEEEGISPEQMHSVTAFAHGYRRMVQGYSDQLSMLSQLSG